MSTPKRFWCWLPLWLTSCLVAFYLVASPAMGATAGIASPTEDSWQAECLDCALAEELAEEAEGVRKARKPAEAAAKVGPQLISDVPLFWHQHCVVPQYLHQADPVASGPPAFVPGVGLRLALLAEWRK